MDKPKWKYDKVTRQHIGTEMANTDYVRWLEEQLAALKAAPAQATGAMVPCPYYITHDLAHLGDGAGIPECACRGYPGKRHQ